MKKFLSRLFDIICFVAGPMFIVGGAFTYRTNEGAMTIGIGLICFGLLSKYWARKD